MEQKIDKLTDALVTVQGLIQKTGKSLAHQRKCSSSTGQNLVRVRDSETTIYHNVVLPLSDLDQSKAKGSHGNQLPVNNRFSSSSEEEANVDTSDELLQLDETIFGFSAKAAVQQPSVTQAPTQQNDPQPTTSSG